MTCEGQCVRGQCLVCGVPQLFQVQEDVKAAEQRVAKLQESLQRNKQWVTKEGDYAVPLLTPSPPCRNSALEGQIKEKLLGAEREVDRLHTWEQQLSSKLHHRRQKAKLTVF